MNIVYRAEKKEFCKGKEYILIDELEKNIKEREECGGTGILYTSAEDAINRILELEKCNE